MSKQKESCSIKGCRRRFDVLYLRRRFCSWHWAEECNRQDEKEREAMDAHYASQLDADCIRDEMSRAVVDVVIDEIVAELQQEDSLGSEIIKDLTDLCETAESGRPIEETHCEGRR
ncbi:MAG: hypothetical protein GY906_39070 [bacterium]|nr:hypothetical protein [bacterium]